MGRKAGGLIGFGLGVVVLASLVSLLIPVTRERRRSGLVGRWVVPVGLFFLLRWLLRLPNPNGHPRLGAGETSGRVGIFPGRGEVQLEVDRVDDLKLIEGIGPSIERMLQGEGIRTYRHLAAADVDYLKSLLGEAGIGGISDPYTWPEQALLAAEGRLDDLRTYQGALKAGREG